MPSTEVNAAIAALETQLHHYENLLDQSISNGEILAKTKLILHNLREVSRQLNELKKLKEENVTRKKLKTKSQQ
jgi:hypothetical protein